MRGWRYGAWGAGRAFALARATSTRPPVEARKVASWQARLLSLTTTRIRAASAVQAVQYLSSARNVPNGSAVRDKGEGRGLHQRGVRNVGKSPRRGGHFPTHVPRVDCLRFLSPRANRPRKFHTATLSYTFQSVSISRTLNTPDSGVFFSSTRPMSGTVQQSPGSRTDRCAPHTSLGL